MYRCIVAPVDGTAFGEHALPLAAAIARQSGASLHVAHVHIPLIAASGLETVAFRGPWNDIAKREQRAYLDALVRRLAELHRVRADYSLMEGSVPHSLERFARECEASLVVMSTHAHSGLRRLWHHGVAEHVARSLPLPVLLVRPDEPDAAPDLATLPSPAHLLVPLDGTPYAESIVQHAVALGRSFRARYTLLRVVRAAGHDSRRIGTRLQTDREVDRARLGARQYLNAMAERLRAGGLAVRTHVVAAADPAAAILDTVRGAAERLGAPVDVIAMESHPHRAVARILASHTADRVLRDSPVPVLLFDPPARPAPREAAALLGARV